MLPRSPDVKVHKVRNIRIGPNVNLSSDTISPLIFISHFLQNSTQNFVLCLLHNLNFQLQTSCQADVFYVHPHKVGLKKDANLCGVCTVAFLDTGT